MILSKEVPAQTNKLKFCRRTIVLVSSSALILMENTKASLAKMNDSARNPRSLRRLVVPEATIERGSKFFDPHRFSDIIIHPCG
jgi:hypothetical protein